MLQDYHHMATTLYKKLMRHDVIPIDFTDVCNALSNYLKQYDGCKVSYDLLADFHPHLKEDAKINFPISYDCTDMFLVWILIPDVYHF